MKDFEKCKWAESCGYDICIPEYCPEYKAVRMNNGDRIREMSNKELAIFFAKHDIEQSCLRLQEQGYAPTATQLKAIETTLHDAFYRWLQMPVEDE